MTHPTAALVLFGVSVLLFLFAGVLLQGAAPQFGLIGSQLFAFLLPALFAATMMLRAPDGPVPLSIRRLGFGGAAIIWVVVTSMVLGMSANAVTGLLSQIVPGWAELATAYEAMFVSLMFPDDPMRRIAAVVAVVVVAPVCEETLFRGVILPLQRAGIGSVAAAVALNGMLFALIHMNPLSFIALFAVGAFFAHLGVMSGSLWPCIIAHATLNFVNGVIAPRLLDEVVASAPSAATYAVASVVLVFVTALCWYLGARHFRTQDNDA